MCGTNLHNGCIDIIQEMHGPFDIVPEVINQHLVYLNSGVHCFIKVTDWRTTEQSGFTHVTDTALCVLLLVYPSFYLQST